MLEKLRFLLGSMLVLLIISCTNVSLENNILDLRNDTEDTQTISDKLSEKIVKNKDINIINAQGYNEALFVTWNLTTSYHYVVSYRSNDTANWTQVDDKLIRLYPDFARVDIAGLRSQEYDVKIEGIDISGNFNGFSVVKESLIVEAHDRQGFAFVDPRSGLFNKSLASGAYNVDGTLRDNTNVIYLTDDNKDSVTANINGTNRVGIGNIMNAARNTNSIINVRVIGKVTMPAPSTINDGDLRIQNMRSGITFEGIGEDAVIFGWGLRIQDSQNVEIRNLAFKLTKSLEGDSILMNGNDRTGITPNQNIWIHNNDFFQGENFDYLGGSREEDQEKGDGTTDIVRSRHITLSHNIYWDTGKSILVGNVGDCSFMTTNITIHHNWFNHSDTRHARVRYANVHFFNNFYDSVGTGLGATLGSSLLSQSNVFHNVTNPMGISRQGTAGTGFSNENGGIIVSIDDKFTGTSQIPRSHDENESSFDRVVAENMNESISDTIRTLYGNTYFSNFHLETNFPPINALPVNEVANYVEKNAGRLGNSFKFIFTTGVTSSINQELLSKLRTYTSNIVRIGIGNVQEPIPPIAPPDKENWDSTIRFADNNEIIRSGPNPDAVSIQTNIYFFNDSRLPVVINGYTITHGPRLQNVEGLYLSFTITSDSVVYLYVGRVRIGTSSFLNINNERVDFLPNLGPMANPNYFMGYVRLKLVAGTYTITRGSSEKIILMMDFFRI